MFFLTFRLTSDKFSDGKQDFLPKLNINHHEEFVEGRLIGIHTENG